MKLFPLICHSNNIKVYSFCLKCQQPSFSIITGSISIFLWKCLDSMLSLIYFHKKEETLKNELNTECLNRKRSRNLEFSLVPNFSLCSWRSNCTIYFLYRLTPILWYYFYITSFDLLYFNYAIISIRTYCIFAKRTNSSQRRAAPHFTANGLIPSFE